MGNRTTTCLAATLALSACSGASQTNEPGQSEITDRDDAIFAGFDVKTTTLDAVGSLGVELRWPDRSGPVPANGGSPAMYFPICTATLVGPNAVLTAKHCTWLFDIFPMYWAPGSENAKEPTKKYRLVDAILASPSTGGSIGIGADVAVFFTDETPSVAPIATADGALTTADLGRKFYAIGYGSQNNLQGGGLSLTGERKLGTLTLNAIEGKKFQLLFGSWEAFLDNLAGMGVSIEACLADPACAESLEKTWATDMFPRYEAYLGNQPGDAQACHGDSGGPLLGTVFDASTNTHRRSIHGVVSHGWFTPEQRCYGNFYATFGPEVQPLLAQALTWVDPCGDVTEQGSCMGGVATRCTRPKEGKRRVTSVDCAPLGLTCGEGSHGEASCVDPAASETTTVAEVAPVAPTEDEIRTALENDFYGLDPEQAHFLRGN